jgi:glycine cleavage system transcriptional repressor
VDPEELARQVRQAAGDPDYQVVARACGPARPVPAGVRTEKFVVTAFGRDKPGIVLRFSQYLAGRDINIVDLYGDRKGDDFVLIAQAEVPARWDFRTLQADLEELGRTESFTVRLQHENIFVATNQIRLPR